MCPSKYDCSVGEYSSVVETCRLCLLAKKSYVDIFSTTTRDGCPLVEKLNESFGIQAFLEDELPRCVCIDCLRHMRRGNISYCLWSTLDYLIRMEEDNEKLTSSFHIPKEDTLDFLFNDGGKTSPASSGRQRNDNCAEMGVVEPDACGSSEGASGDVAFEYCWCPECNAEFLSKEELRTHRKTHAKSDSVDRIGVEMEAEVSLEEIGLLSGELSILRSKLCCGKCGREFRDEGRLVAHINKHDFKCKPRNFEVLNAMLMDLRSIRSKGNALRRSTSKELLRRVDSTCAEGGRSLQIASLRSVKEERSFQDGELTSSPDIGMVKGHFKTILKENGGSTSCKSSTDVRPKQSAVDLNEGEFRKENCFVLDEVSSEKSLKMKELSLESKLNGSLPALLSSRSYEKSTNGSNVDCLFYCDYCSKPSESKSTLRKHIVMCHLTMEVNKCTVCHFVFPTERELKSHAALHTSKNKYICSVCNSNFTSRKLMIAHLNGSHGTNKGCVCSICLTGFPSRVELRFHQLSHENDKKFICSNCEKCYISEGTLKIHLRLCLKLTSFKCETCHKLLYSKTSFEFHLLTHGTTKRFRCPQCPKMLTHECTLVKHIKLVHLKLKPYECGVCKRKFGLRLDLEKHLAVHSDDKPFACHLCGKTFKLKGYVKSHLRLVHSEV